MTAPQPVPGQYGPEQIARPISGPDAHDVAHLTALLDMLADFDSNEQRARYLLSSDWMRDRGAAAAARLAAGGQR